MKRAISDLLDGYPADERNLPGGENLSLSRIKEKTMKKLQEQENGIVHQNTAQMEPHSRHRFHMGTKFLIAAAVTAMLACSALAVVPAAERAGDWLRGFFSERSEKASSQPVTTAQLDAASDIGTVLREEDLSVTVNGATMTPLAAMADENIYYLRLRITAPEGVVLRDYTEEEGFYQPFGDCAEEMLSLDASYENGGWTASFTCLPDENPNDNVKDFVLSLASCAGGDLCFNDGKSKRLTLHGLWVQSPGKDYEEIVRGDFSFDIGQYFESHVLKPDCTGVSYRLQSVDAVVTLREMALSPLSLSVSFDVSGSYDHDMVQPNPRMFAVVLKDGSVAGWDSEGPATASVENHLCLVFAAPLDLEQVDYIQCGDQKILLPEDEPM